MKKFQEIRQLSEVDNKFSQGDSKKPKKLETDKTFLAPDRSAAKKPVKFTKPDGTIGIKMVPVDRDILKKISVLNKVSNEEVEKTDETCWPNYKQVGMKKKNGKEVPNCVPEEYVNEKLSVKQGAGAWISDFKTSDAPQFKNKSAKERREMALAAYLKAKNEAQTRKKSVKY